MSYLRMKLQSVDWQSAVLDRGNGTSFGLGQGDEVVRYFHHLIAMTHPDIHLLRNAREDRIGRYDIATGATEFPRRHIGHCASQGFASKLHSIANTENWNARPK